MISDAEVFDYFQQRIKTELLNHNVIHNNKYCRAFAEGSIDIDDVRYFTQQFSVFSNQFIIAQLKKVLNAPTLEEMHDGKEILMNELGVVFKDGSGSIENSVFRFKDKKGKEQTVY